MFRQLFLFLVFVFSAVNIQAEKINLKGLDGFALSGNYVAAASRSNKGVLMLHQCNADKSMYKDLAIQFATSGFSSMSLDFRGFGESTTEELSVMALRAKATSREHYFKMYNKLGLGTHRKDDVEIAYQYLRNKIGEKAVISVIGASCGGEQAVILAQKHKPASFIFFSSGMNEQTIGLFDKVSDVPALMIAAQDDEFTFKSLNKVFLEAKSDQSRILSYKGALHGKPLFKHDPELQNLMVQWFKQYTK